MRKEIQRFQFHIGTIAFVYALSNVFIQPYVAFLGLDAAMYGVFQTLNIAVLALSQFAFGYVCDRFSTIRKFITLMIVASMGLAIIIFLTQKKIPTTATLVLLLVIQFMQGPLLTLSENWVMLSPKRLSLFFGNIRLYASLFFSIASLLFGFIFVGNNIAFLFLIITCFYIFPFLLHSRLTDISLQKVSKHYVEEENSEKRMVFNKELLLFMIFSVSCLFFFVSGKYFSFLGYMFTSVGVAQKDVTAYMGATAFLMGISELPMFFNGTKLLKRFGARKLFFTALTVSLIRMIIMILFPHPLVFVLVGAMQGIIFPSYLLSLRMISKELVPRSVFNTVFGILMFSQTIGEMLFTFSLKDFVNQHQLHVMYIVCMIAILLGMLSYLVFLFVEKMNKNEVLTA